MMLFGFQFYSQIKSKKYLPEYRKIYWVGFIHTDASKLWRIPLGTVRDADQTLVYVVRPCVKLM